MEEKMLITFCAAVLHVNLFLQKAKQAQGGKNQIIVSNTYLVE